VSLYINANIGTIEGETKKPNIPCGLLFCFRLEFRGLGVSGGDASDIGIWPALRVTKIS